MIANGYKKGQLEHVEILFKWYRAHPNSSGQDDGSRTSETAYRLSNLTYDIGQSGHQEPEDVESDPVVSGPAKGISEEDLVDKYNEWLFDKSPDRPAFEEFLGLSPDSIKYDSENLFLGVAALDGKQSDSSPSYYLVPSPNSDPKLNLSNLTDYFEGGASEQPIVNHELIKPAKVREGFFASDVKSSESEGMDFLLLIQEKGKVWLR